MGLTAVSRAHAWLKLRAIIHAAIGLIVSHTHPWLINSFIKFEFDSTESHMDPDLGRGIQISLVLRDARYDCIRHHLRVCVLDHSFLNLRSSHSNRFTLLGRLTCTHVYLISASLFIIILFKFIFKNFTEI